MYADIVFRMFPGSASPSGEYLLFCKGADSSIFPRVVSGKVEQVKARVEQNAVVSSGTASQMNVLVKPPGFTLVGDW